jgi:hypothetical protein
MMSTSSSQQTSQPALQPAPQQTSQPASQQTSQQTNNLFSDLRIEIDAQMKKTIPTFCCTRNLIRKLLDADTDIVTLFTTVLTLNNFYHNVDFKMFQMLYNVCNPKPTDEQVKTVVINIVSRKYSISDWINHSRNYGWGVIILTDVNFDWLNQPSFTQELLTPLLKVDDTFVGYLKEKFDQLVDIFYKTKDDNVNIWVPILCAEINKVTGYQNFPKGKNRKEAIRKTLLTNQFNCLVENLKPKTTLIRNLSNEQNRLKKQFHQSEVVSLRTEINMYKTIVSKFGIEITKKRPSDEDDPKSKKQRMDQFDGRDREFLTMYT